VLSKCPRQRDLTNVTNVRKKMNHSQHNSGMIPKATPIHSPIITAFYVGGDLMQFILLSLCALALSLPAHAHGPTPQKAKESISLQAPADKVWAVVKQFDAIDQWHPDVKKSEGDGSNQSGGKRTLTFHNGQSLVEELDYYNEKEREYSYRLKTENTLAFPTSSHSVDLKVSVGDTPDTSVVTLKSRFYRGDTGNTPPSHLSDEAAVRAMTDFFRHGLDGLKNKLEQPK